MQWGCLRQTHKTAKRIFKVVCDVGPLHLVEKGAMNRDLENLGRLQGEQPMELNLNVFWNLIRRTGHS